MSAIAIPNIPTPASAQPPAKYLFTVAEFNALQDSRTLRTSNRTELIEGEVFEMSPIGEFHGFAFDELDEIISEQLDLKRYRKRGQGSLVLEGSKLLPDLMILKRETASLRKDPTATDVLLLVEVSDSSLAFDKNVKLPIYAAAGIVEVWIVDLVAKRVECYTDPVPDQRSYGSKRTLDATQTAEPRYVEELVVELSRLF